MNSHWQSIVIIVITFAVPLLVARVAMPMAATIARQVGLVDRVGKDPMTTRSLPRSGGIALFLAFLVGLGITFVLPVDRHYDPHEATRLALLVIGGALIFVVMLADDVVNLSPRVKLAWQLVAAMLVSLPAIWGPGQGIVIADFRLPFTGTLQLPMLVAIPFTIFWIVGMMNTMNWVDGLDGLAGGVTLIACGVLFAHTYFQPDNARQFTIALLPLVLAGCIAGFMPFNWHPARIIMGDSGAMFIGFMLAGISVIGGAKLATTLLALAIPILDVGWMILARLIRRQSPMQRDTRHFHHRLYQLGLSQRQVVIIYYSLCLIFGLLALVLEETAAKLAALIVAAILLGVLLLALARWQPSGTGRQL